MNLLESQLLDKLKELKETYGVFGIKSEFEAEGSRLEDLMRMQELVLRAGIGITLKIGGGEAIFDMRRGRDVGVAEIIAPMIESPFAVSKFLTAAKIVFTEDELEDVALAINVETVTGYKQFAEMLEVPGFSTIGGLTVGRVDLTHSMGFENDYVDSDQVFQMCMEMFTRMRERYPKAHIIMGGLVGPSSVEIVDRFPSGLVDGYEMRKVMFSTALPVAKRLEGYAKAVEFELAWCQNKVNVHTRVTKEDERYMGRLKAIREGLAQKGI